MKPGSERKEWTFEAIQSQRLDKYITAVYDDDDVSRAQIQSWIKAGLVEVNGKQVKPNYKLEQQDHIVLCLPEAEETEIQPEPMNLHIIYEDEDVIVVNKPRGLVVHPAPGHATGTLVNGLLAHCQHLSAVNGAFRQGIVHRLDKDTSGLLMAAKNDDAHIALAEQLKARSVKRGYVAIVQGSIRHEQGKVDAPIARHERKRKEMAVASHGKQAVTHFRVLERFSAHTLLELELETGRTHQIRVHMKYIGHPLVGDPKYGSPNRFFRGQALHAKMLGFTHPRSGKSMLFDSDLPQDMEQAVQLLRSGKRLQ